jgi:hypothetical protein
MDIWQTLSRRLLAWVDDTAAGAQLSALIEERFGDAAEFQQQLLELKDYLAKLEKARLVLENRLALNKKLLTCLERRHGDTRHMNANIAKIEHDLKQTMAYIATFKDKIDNLLA